MADCAGGNAGRARGRSCKGNGRRVRPVCLKKLAVQKNMGKSSLSFLFLCQKRWEKSVIIEAFLKKTPAENSYRNSRCSVMKNLCFRRQRVEPAGRACRGNVRRGRPVCLKTCGAKSRAGQASLFFSAKEREEKYLFRMPV